MHDPARLLVVEDDPDNRELMSEILVMQGYEVVCARDGQDAIDRLRGGLAPDLIVLDLMMPRMNGWAFVEAVRGEPALARCPIVIVSADGKASEKAEKLDVAAGVVKPVDIGDLTRLVDRLLRR